MDAEDEHPSSSLRHSEVASVENPVGPPIPEFPQRTEERPKVAAGIRGEESRYVLEEDGGRSVSLHKSKEREGEAGTLAGEAAALPGDGEVLAGEASGPEVGSSPSGIRPTVGAMSGSVIPSVPVPTCQWNACGDINDASEVRDSWPSLGEDGAGVGVDLGEGDGSPSGSLQPKVNAAGS